MTRRCVIGSCVNHPAGHGPGFDACAADPEHGLLVLSDGANSCPESGRAAQWLCEATVQAIRREGRDLDLQAWVRSAHTHIQTAFAVSAATWLLLQVEPSRLRVAGVGDSLLRVYGMRWRHWGAWRSVLELPRDRDAAGRVYQLVGSEVLEQVHQATLADGTRSLVLVMTDGAADALSAHDIDTALRSLGRGAPSADDLDYLCAGLAEQAIIRGSRDDVSVALAWVGP